MAKITEPKFSIWLGTVEPLLNCVQIMDELDGWKFSNAFKWIVLSNGRLQEDMREVSERYSLLEFVPTLEFAQGFNAGNPWPLQLKPKVSIERICLSTDSYEWPYDYKRALENLLTLYRALIDMMRGGFLLGRGENSEGVQVDIPVNEWWNEDAYIDFGSGDLYQGTAEDGRLICRSITVHRPTVGALDLEGLYLSSAFLQYVVRDEGVQALLGRTAGYEAVSRGEFWGRVREGFPLDLAGWWPLQLAREACTPSGSMSNEELLESAVADRLGLLLRPVRDFDLFGKVSPNLVAMEKDFDGTERELEYGALLNDDLYFHAWSSAIGLWKTEQGELPPEGPQTLHPDVRLSLPMGVVGEDIPRLPDGSSYDYPWHKVLDLALARLFDGERPESGSDFVRWMESLFMDEGFGDVRKIDRWIYERLPALWARLTIDRYGQFKDGAPDKRPWYKSLDGALVRLIFDDDQPGSGEAFADIVGGEYAKLYGLRPASKSVTGWLRSEFPELWKRLDRL